MTVLDRVLALRPSNVVARLGASRVPVLSPLDVIRGLGERPAAVLTVPVTVPRALPGLLRAARDADAPLGLALPWPWPERGALPGFVDRVRACAEELKLQRPIFVEAGPIPVAAPLERLQAAVYEVVDAGFSLVGLDLSAFEPAEAAAAFREVAQGATERELPVEVTPAPRAEAVNLLSALPGCITRLVEGDIPALASAARAGGAAVCAEEREPLSEPVATAWIDAGVRKVRASATFARAGREEAFWYAEALELFGKLRAEGTGTQIMQVLAERQDEG